MRSSFIGWPRGQGRCLRKPAPPRRRLGRLGPEQSWDGRGHRRDIGDHWPATVSTADGLILILVVWRSPSRYWVRASARIAESNSWVIGPSLSPAAFGL